MFRARVIVLAFAIVTVLVDAALSVLPYISDGIVLQIRSSIMLNEKDLESAAVAKLSTCSSLTDGPFCGTFLAGHGEFGVGEGLRSNDYISSAGDLLQGGDVGAAGSLSSARLVVDGVLSQQLLAHNQHAFDWSPETYRTFSSLVSRVVSSMAGGSKSVAGSSSSTRATIGQGLRLLSAQSGSRCFRLSFDQLSPAHPYVHASFSIGLPPAFAATWRGLWAIETAPAARRREEGTEAVSWATRVVLRSAVGYLTFKDPVVVRRLLVGVPATPQISKAGTPWGAGGMICGRSRNRERWCTSLDEAAGAQVSTDAADVVAASNRESNLSGYRYIDLGNSFHSVDEVAFIATPPDGLRIALVEVAATPPTHPRSDTSPEQRQVVLLKKTGGRSSLSGQIEPVLATVSRDASLWDVNEVLLHNKRLLPQHVGSPGPAALVKKFGSHKEAFQSFQDMVRGIQTGEVRPPHGVSSARIRKEVKALIASIKSDIDQGSTTQGKLERLLEQRIREKAFDGLAAMQVDWHFRGGSARSPRASAAGTTSTNSRDKEEFDEHTDITSANVEEDVSAAEAESEEWADSLADASKALEAQSEKAAKNRKAGGAMDNLEKGSVTFKVVEDASQLQDLLKGLSKGARDVLTNAATAVDADVEAAGNSDDPSSLSDLMSQLLGGTQSVNLGTPSGVADSGEQGSEAGSEPTQNVVSQMESMLEGQIQEMLKGRATEVSTEDSEDGTGTDPKKKVEVRFVKFDPQTGESGEISGDIAQTIAKMFSQAMDKAGAGTGEATEISLGDVVVTDADDDDNSDAEAQQSSDQVFY